MHMNLKSAHSSLSKLFLRSRYILLTVLFLQTLTDFAYSGDLPSTFSITGGAVSMLIDYKDKLPGWNGTDAPPYRYLSGGHAYGAWHNGIPNFYKDGNGQIWMNIPSSESYRFKVDDIASSSGWVFQPSPVYDSRTNMYDTPSTLYHHRIHGGLSWKDYDSRSFISSFYAEGDMLYAFSRNEQYYSMNTTGHADPN